VDVGASLMADGEASEACEPGQGSLDHPAMAPEAVGALDAAPRDAGHDRPLAALGPASAMVIGFVRMKFRGPASRPASAAAHARDDVEGGRQQLAVMPIGAAQLEAERRALAIRDEVALGARATTVRGVRADLGRRRRAPPFAGNDALSIEARFQSSASAAASRSRSARCSRPNTPAVRRGPRTNGAPRLTQSRSRRQHVMPVQPNASRGNRSQPMPDHSTSTIPPRAFRSSHRGRPPLGFGGSGGSSGTTAAHNSPLTRGLVMTPNAEQPNGFC
jgi:hypothetical protein